MFRGTTGFPAGPKSGTFGRPHCDLMRDWEIIDSEAAGPLLAGVRRAIREHGGEPSSRQVDKLLDERLAHRRAGKDAGVDT